MHATPSHHSHTNHAKWLGGKAVFILRVPKQDNLKTCGANLMGEVWNDPRKDPKLPSKRLQIGEGCPDIHSDIHTYNTQSIQSLQVDVWQTSTIYKVGACSRRNISYWHTVRSQNSQQASKQGRAKHTGLEQLSSSSSGSGSGSSSSSKRSSN